MPTDNVLFTYQDKQQLLWIATAKGLVRFDGLHYKLYNNRTNIKAGFKGKAIGKILEDSLSNLWVGTETGLHYYRRKDDQFDQVFYKKDRAGLELIMPQYIDQQNQLWIYSSVAEKLVCYDLERKTFNEQPIECSERLVFFPTQLYKPVSMIASFNLINGIRIIFLENNKVKKISDFFTGDIKNQPPVTITHRIFFEDSTHCWLPASTGLICLNPVTGTFEQYSQFEEQIISPVVSVAALNARYLLVGTQTNGLLIFDKQLQRFIKAFRHLLGDPGTIFSGPVDDIFCQDERSIFVSRYGSGVDIVNISWDGPMQAVSLQATTALNTGNQIRYSEEQQTGIFWLVNEANKILEWDMLENRLSEPASLATFNRENKGQTINAIYYDLSGRSWILTDKEITILERGKPATRLSGLTRAARVIEYGNQLYFISTFDNLYYLDGLTHSWKVIPVPGFKEKGLRSNLTLHVNEHDSTLYVLCEWGQVICKVTITNRLPFVDRISEWSNRLCLESILLPDFTAIILPGNNGPLRFDTRKFSFSGLLSDTLEDIELKSLVKGNDHTYFAISGNSLIKFSLPGWKYSNVDLPVLSVAAGPMKLHSIEVSQAGNLVLSTSNGLVLVDPARLNTSSSYPVIFTHSISIDGKEVPISNSDSSQVEVQLPPGYRNVDITLSNVSFLQENSLYSIRYHIEGQDTVLQKPNTSGHIYLNALPQGTYPLKITDPSGMKLLKTYLLIAKPYWYETWLFRVAALFFISLMAYMFFRWRMNQVRRTTRLKAEYESQMIRLEMQNLRSQMNPHFIFNSLNSINSFIVENKTHLASDYLTKFSKLIRLILDNSRNEVISLNRELETLQLYLLMETLRFDQKFGFEITVDEKLDRDGVRIPPMIIQPYVENAIWHGLMQKNGKGNVTIGLKKSADNQLLLITILDNGIGREKAAKLNSKTGSTNKSFGMEITSNRIAKLDAANSVEISDLKDENGNACGTKVQLALSLNQFSMES